MALYNNLTGVVGCEGRGKVMDLQAISAFPLDLKPTLGHGLVHQHIFVPHGLDKIFPLGKSSHLACVYLTDCSWLFLL